jgi:hypothetical protein
LVLIGRVLKEVDLTDDEDWLSFPVDALHPPCSLVVEPKDGLEELLLARAVPSADAQNVLSILF